MREGVQFVGELFAVSTNIEGGWLEILVKGCEK